jgi:hypothetical protein
MFTKYATISRFKVIHTRFIKSLTREQFDAYTLALDFKIETQLRAN